MKTSVSTKAQTLYGRCARYTVAHIHITNHLCTLNNSPMSPYRSICTFDTIYSQLVDVEWCLCMTPNLPSECQTKGERTLPAHNSHQSYIIYFYTDSSLTL